MVSDPGGTSTVKWPRVKKMLVQRTDAFVQIAGCVDFAVGRFLIDARLRLLSVSPSTHDRNRSHRPRPSSRCESNQLLLAAPTLHQFQLRQTLLVRNVGDPFHPVTSVGGSCHIHRKSFCTVHRQRQDHEQIVELTAEVRAIEDAFSVWGPLWPRPIKRLFLVNEPGLTGIHDVGFDRRSPESSRAQRSIAIGDEDEFLAVRRPSRRDMNVVVAEVQTAATELVIDCDGRDVPFLTVVDFSYENVEPTVGSVETYARRLPSGDQAGSRFSKAPVVSAEDLPVSTLKSITLMLFPSSSAV